MSERAPSPSAVPSTPPAAPLHGVHQSSPSDASLPTPPPTAHSWLLRPPPSSASVPSRRFSYSCTPTTRCSPPRRRRSDSLRIRGLRRAMMGMRHSSRVRPEHLGASPTGGLQSNCSMECRPLGGAPVAAESAGGYRPTTNCGFGRPRQAPRKKAPPPSPETTTIAEGTTLVNELVHGDNHDSPGARFQTFVLLNYRCPVVRPLCFPLVSPVDLWISQSNGDVLAPPTLVSAALNYHFCGPLEFFCVDVCSDFLFSTTVASVSVKNHMCRISVFAGVPWC